MPIISFSAHRIICSSQRRLHSLPQYLFFLIATLGCASLFPCSLSLDARYQYCQNNSKCGTAHIHYPLGVGSCGCGHPSFQINCVQNSSFVIPIRGRNYTILMFLPPKLVITRGQNCQFLNDSKNSRIQSLEFAGTVFTFTATVNLTLSVYKCKEQDHLSLPKCSASSSVYYAYKKENSASACSMEQVPVYAVLIQPLAVGLQYERCASCEGSHGICGYNTSVSTAPPQFVCYCNDGPSTDKCPGHDADMNPSSYGPRNKADMNSSSNGPQNKAIKIIGCIFGGVGLIAIVSLFLTSYAKKRSHPLDSSTTKVEKFLQDYAYEAPMPIRYSLLDLKKITNNFAEKLGEGGYGVVYKGKLWNGALMAVKLLDSHRQSQTQFMNEVTTIGRVHHINLVRLLGYCFESCTSALVYEYMVNGSLEKFIFARRENGQILSLEQLHSIALGVARGIAYLHQDCEKRIIHFDIKPQNILLDADFTPKVADFGLAKLCGKGDDHISITVPRGTPGYVAPEVWSRDMGPVTGKSDVYSFGMLLLEIVGGRKNIDVQVNRSSQLYFPEWAFKLIDSGQLGMRLRGGEIEAADEEKARKLAKVGLWCIQYNSRDRPCMTRVVQMLQGNEEDVLHPPLPFNSSATPENPPLFHGNFSSS
eukprot:PITA_03841